MLSDQMVDTNADSVAIFVVIFVPALLIYVFWMIHILREKILADQQPYLEAVLVQDTEALRLGRLRYDIGADDLLHVLNLQGRQLNTQFELIGVRNDRLATRIALHLALGGGFTPAANP
jgi:hypothetical protein